MPIYNLVFTLSVWPAADRPTAAYPRLFEDPEALLVVHSSFDCGDGHLSEREQTVFVDMMQRIVAAHSNRDSATALFD
jgi:hypothetical protein